MDNENYQKLRDYALRLLSFRPRSVKEISEKLRKYCIRRNFPDALMDKVVVWLKEQKFLNDSEFVRWWRQQRQTYKPKGLKAIRIELLQKGIDKDTIDSVLSERNKDGINEYDLAVKTVKKKILHMTHLPPIKKKDKLRNLLFRRGFDWETIGKVIDSLKEKE